MRAQLRAVTPGHVTNGGHTIRSAIAINALLYANFMTMYHTTAVIADRCFTLREQRFFSFFCSGDLDLDPMTFMYELDTYSLEIYRMWKNELATSRLSNVIV